jgi:hypothetical protein
MARASSALSISTGAPSRRHSSWRARRPLSAEGAWAAWIVPFRAGSHRIWCFSISEKTYSGAAPNRSTKRGP